MERQSSWIREQLPEEISGLDIDDELEFLCKVAAWIGERSADDYFCSYTTLLIGLLVCEDHLSIWFQNYCAKKQENNPPVDVNAVFTSKQYSPKFRTELLKKASSIQVPEGKKLWTASARNLLAGAAEIARKVSSSEPASLGTRHLLASFAFVPHPAHDSQLAQWHIELGVLRTKFVAFASSSYHELGEDWAVFESGTVENAKSEPDPAGDLIQSLSLPCDRSVKLILRDAASAGGSLSILSLTSALVSAGVSNEQDADIPDALLAFRLAFQDLGHPGAIKELRDRVGHAPSGDGPPNGDAIHRLLELAVKLDEKFESNEVTTNHVIAAFLISDDSIIDTVTSSVGVNRTALRDQIVSKMSESDGTKADSWRSIFGRPETESLTDQTGAMNINIEGSNSVTDGERPRIGIAPLDSDVVTADAKDHLDVKREARAFARVAASKNTVPPLSVGVFGEWGSGKTFFMEKMFAHVDRLQKTARRASEKMESTAYHTHIVQIRFNAWHYMETNLWASLVDHIFRELDNWLHRDQKQEPKQIDALFEQLSTARMLKLDAVVRLINARRRRKEAEKNVERARHELAATETKGETVSREEFWNAVRKALGQAFNNVDTSKISQAAESLGFRDAENSAKELMDALSQARDQAQRGRLIFRSVASRLGSVKWTGILVALLILVPSLAPVVIDWIASLLKDGAVTSILDRISGTVLAVCSVAATATGWIGTAVGFTSKALNRLNAFQDELDQKLQKQEGSTPDPILQAEQVLAQRRKVVEIAEGSLEKANQLEEEARLDFGDTARGRLNRFIRDKIIDGDYAKHLGIIATVRKDFDQLAEIMADVVEQEEKRAVLSEYESDLIAYREKIKALELDKLVEDGLLLGDEKEAIEAAQDPPDKNLRFFQRIVLYIDDLDRCPPEKVVQVLQACHLLLCFPLFIVVVAVDARWVAGALLKRYKGLLEEDGDGQPGAATAGRIEGTASPRDYLEKIFQIPYWVRRMHGNASRTFTTDLVGQVIGEGGGDQPSKPAKETASAEASSGEASDALEVKAKATRQADAGQRQSHSVTAVGTTPDTDDSVSDADGGGEPSVVTGDGPRLTQAVGEEKSTEGEEPIDETGSQELEDEDSVDPNPASLRVTRHERDFLVLLAPHAGKSPRTIKRYVNVYRLLRTGLSDDTLDGLVGKSGESLTYRAIVGQLAIVTGIPTLADSYFEALGPEEPPVEDTEAGKPVGKEVSTPGELLEKLEKSGSLTQSAEWAALKATLKTLISIEDSAGMLTEMRKHANVVKRYSFSARPYL